MFKNTIYNLLSIFLRGSKMPIGRKIQDRLPFKGVFSIKTPYGKFKMRGTGKWVENSLFWNGISGYEPSTLIPFMHLCLHAECVFDVGANSGLFSLVAKNSNAACKVYAFEPMPKFKEILIENNNLNKWNIKACQLALANEERIAKFYMPSEYNGNIYSSSLNSEHYYAHQSTEPISFEVDVTTLDSFIGKNEIKKIDILKIDAEGMDFEVLLGFKANIAVMLPLIIIEIQSIENALKIKKFLDEFGYLYYSFDDYQKIELLDVPFNGRSLNYFCVPKHKNELLNLFYN